MVKWKEFKLGDGKVTELIMGQSPPSNTYNKEKIGLPFYQGKKEFGELYPTVEKWCSKPNKIAESGDVLLSVRAPVGPTNLAFEKCCIGRGLASIRPNLDLIETKFLLFYFQNFELEISSKGQGSTFQAISGKELRNLKIPLPPLPEQQRIVAKLDGLFAKIDQAIGLLKENIVHTEALMGSVLDEEFKKLDCKWFKLEEITTMVGGGTPKTAISEYWADEVVWLSPVDLPPIGVISKVSDSGKKISKLGLQKSSAKLLPKGTVVFSSRASIGKIAITECELATNQGFTNFIPNEGVDNVYLAKTLKHFTPKIEALSNSTTFKEVSKTSLKGFEIPLPSIKIQLKLSKLFSEYQEKIDGIVSIQTQKLSHLKALKSSLLDQAFKGEL
jgi:type I restriction enzyme S subunit